MLNAKDLVDIFEIFQKSTHIDTNFDKVDKSTNSSLIGNEPHELQTKSIIKKAVFVITPFDGDVSKVGQLRRYAAKCAKNSHANNESPILSFSFNQNISGTIGTKSEIDSALNDQFTWILKSDYVVVYTDFASNVIMETLINYAKLKNKSRNKILCEIDYFISIIKFKIRHFIK